MAKNYLLFPPLSFAGYCHRSYAYLSRSGEKKGRPYPGVWFKLVYCGDHAIFKPLSGKRLYGRTLALPGINRFFFTFVHLLMRAGRKKGIAVCIAITCLYSYLTIKQNAYWQDALSFFKRTLFFAPYSYDIHLNLGVAYHEMGRLKEAEDSYKRAITINPRRLRAYSNLAVLYASQGRFDDALSQFNAALETNRNFPEAYLQKELYTGLKEIKRKP